MADFTSADPEIEPPGPKVPRLTTLFKKRQGPNLDTFPLQWAVPVSDTGGIWRVVVVFTDNTVDGSDQGRWIPLDLADDGSGTWRGTMDISGIETLTYVVQALDNHGNVSWLEYETTQLPASGVELRIPMPVDVVDFQLFADGFESGNVSMWSSSVP